MNPEAEEFANCVEFLLDPRVCEEETSHFMPLYFKDLNYNYDAFLEVDNNKNPYIRVSMPENFIGPVDDFLLNHQIEPFTFFEYIYEKNYNIEILLDDLKEKAYVRAVMASQVSQLFATKFGQETLDQAVQDFENFTNSLIGTISSIIKKPSNKKFTLIDGGY